MIYFKKIENYKKFLAYRFIYIKISQKVNIKRDISNFPFWAPNKPPFLRKILKIHIAYTLSQTKAVLHTEFHGNRFSRSPVMPAQTDRHTDRQTHRQTDTQTDRQTHRQTDTQTDRHTDRQTDRQKIISKM